MKPHLLISLALVCAIASAGQAGAAVSSPRSPEPAATPAITERTAPVPTAGPAAMLAVPAPAGTPAVPASGPPAPGDINLGITPLRVELGIKAGVETSQPIRITNSSSDIVQLRGTVLDWTLTPSGDLAYRKRGETTWGCGKWIQINPVEFALPPGQTQLVRYTMSVPAAAPVGGYHCAISFDMLPPPRAKIDSPMGVINLIRMLTAIYATVGAPEVEARIQRLELSRKAGKGEKGWEIVTEFENPGNTHYRVDGMVELTSEEGRVIGKFDYSNFPVLPKTPRVARFDVPGELPPGLYRLHAIVDVGTKERLAAETKITVTAR
jgi:hypothetical protein